MQKRCAPWACTWLLQKACLLTCMMMWHYVWWCDTMYDDVTLCMMMWHYAWWFDTMHDDMTLCMMIWHAFSSRRRRDVLLARPRLVSSFLCHTTRYQGMYTHVSSSSYDTHVSSFLCHTTRYQGMYTHVSSSSYDTHVSSFLWTHFCLHALSPPSSVIRVLICTKPTWHRALSPDLWPRLVQLNPKPETALSPCSLPVSRPMTSFSSTKLH